MRTFKLCGIVGVLSMLIGCATSGSTDPRKDSLVTAVKCSFTSDCDNYNKDKERDLEAERDEARRLESEANTANVELASSQAAVASLQQSLNELDSSITTMQKQADEANSAAGDTNDEIAALKTQLDTLQKETLEVESDVLKEDISVKQAETKRTSLVSRRDELEQLLQTILSSQ